MSPNQEKVIDLAVDLIRELLEKNLPAACRDADDAFQADENADHPEVSLSLTVKFDPLDEAPEVSTKVSWTVRKTDEATGQVYTQQTMLPFADVRKQGCAVQVKTDAGTVKFPALNDGGAQ